MELENLNVPQFDDLKHPDVLKPAILNAKRSAALGFWLVATPAFFLACVFMKYFLGWKEGLLRHFEDFWAALDHDPVGKTFTIVVLLIAPLIAFVMNLLAVIHVRFDRKRRELDINLKLRWQNLLLAAIALLLPVIFVLHSLIEDIYESLSGH